MPAMSCCNTSNTKPATDSSSTDSPPTGSGCCGGSTSCGTDKPTLNQAQIEQVIGQLQGWHYDADENYMVAVIRFPDFGRAWSFMSLIALAAERLDHHPSWHNVYNRLTIHLTTHDAGGVTNLDVTLAHYINQQLKNYQGVYEPI
jgi:4a-hydroxytetrahydrobiopterin dehydratase